MPDFRVTYDDGSVEVLQAALLVQDEQTYAFVSFAGPGSERWVSRARAGVASVEREP